MGLIKIFKPGRGAVAQLLERCNQLTDGLEFDSRPRHKVVGKIQAVPLELEISALFGKKSQKRLLSLFP